MDESPVSLGLVLVSTLLALLLIPLISNLLSPGSDDSASAETASHNELVTKRFQQSAAMERKADETIENENSYLQGASGNSHDMVSEAEEMADNTTSISVSSPAEPSTEPSSSSSPLSNGNNWRCVCENGASFLPASMLGPMAVMRMSTGQCYHKQT